MMHKLNRQIRIAAAFGIGLGAAVSALPAMAADQTQHLRGQIDSVSDSGFTMSTKAGEKRRVKLSSDTRLAAVTRGDLSNIQEGTFIGTANVKRDGENQALEMVIFPPSMKGTGLGDYAWDLSPSMVQGNSSQGSSMSSGSSMTNGTVTSESSGSMSSGSSMTNGTVSSKSGDSLSSGSSMTNGTVKGQSTNGQSMTLNVDYGQGSKKIVVPADVPTVKVQPGEKTDLKKDAHVFVAAPQSSGTINAQMVIVGKNGVVPPM